MSVNIKIPKISPFQMHTGQYENWFAEHRWVYEAELRAVKALLPESGRGVEVGVGTDRFEEIRQPVLILRDEIMPIYEFKCPNGTITEKLVKTGTDEINCPKCRQKANRVISLCTFNLKGGGWYIDGYASKKNKSKT